MLSRYSWREEYDVAGEHIQDNGALTMVRRYVLQYIFPKGKDGQPDHAVIDAAVPEIVRHLDVLEQVNDSRDYLAGSAMSMADLFLEPILAYVGMFPEGAELLAKFPQYPARADGHARQPELRGNAAATGLTRRPAGHAGRPACPGNCLQSVQTAVCQPLCCWHGAVHPNGRTPVIHPCRTNANSAQPTRPATTATASRANFPAG